MPWPSLLVLGGATFTMVSAEMLPTAVLAPMSADLGVSTARGGLLVALWAATVVVATFPLVRATRRRDPRAVIAGALLALAVSALASAAASSYPMAVGARLVGAAATGLLWSTVNAHVADLVAPESLARAVSVVLGGATLGIVLGTPAASLLARTASWRLAFGAVAALAVVAAVLVRRVVAPAGGRAPVPAGGRTGGRGPLVAVAVLVGLALVGHFAAYTFVTRLVAPVAGRVPGGTSGLLLLFGIASALSVVLVGRFGDVRLRAALVTTTGAVALVLLGLAVVDADPLVAVVLVAAWGLTTGALPPLAQTVILQVAGPEHRTSAGTVIPVVFNLGIAVGAAAGSGIVASAGTAALPVPAAVAVAVAALGLVRVLRGPRARTSPVPVSHPSESGRPAQAPLG
jgi:MFS transporter, DHA1 family, inner membrane transport protein